MRINCAPSWLYLQDVKELYMTSNCDVVKLVKFHDCRFVCVLFKVDLVV